ncbi:citrate lyase holo-[acyl-carrier protein] synthase [Candidatus Cetobacterium colombiensis]|uniref:Citrate lyase holo-[acyl-carrier protein] synthase n=1 Tax=Candidatus Cetobacterium colombiensis TaxID=3073100 RepID=A0ABU4WA31_9FUSO|nr:citrate lyase holo-[acyl-carrier protein] synthase [Candidatus Cetobacterium colombiensis]MDX8336402.1 citrate lyase holo-[acyl-carrier protein] synthase [Candidatus Cetobacterium colombiensis]
MFNLEEFLLMREKRVVIQNEIINNFKNPILVLRANYPGEEKNHFVPKYILEIMNEEILKIFNSNIIFQEKINSIEGPTYIYSLKENGRNIKKLAMEIENLHILGRCVDIDVFDKDGYPFSRKDFGGEKRKCLLCEEMAFVCGRNRTHSLKEIQEVIEKKLEEYLKSKKVAENISSSFSNLALKSIILEVAAAPSFGLVAPHTKGSHEDMDFFTFINSGFSLNNYFKEVTLAGFSPLSVDLIFRKIRHMGKIAENDMFKATKDVNTHKGMIFLMGITVALSAKAKFEKLPFSEISTLIKEMCRDILKDFDNIKEKTNLTHGEKLYLKHGIVGVRGIVKNGLDILFLGAIDIFKNSLNKGEHINQAMVRTLIFLMSKLEDTTILHRHNIETLNFVKAKAQELHLTFNEIELDLNLLKEIELDFINKRISPGGAADLLAVTMFLSFISIYF